MTAGRELLVEIYREAVASLAGDRLVREALAGIPRPERATVLALGKASAAMLRGLHDAWGPLPGVAVGPGDPPDLPFVRAALPSGVPSASPRPASASPTVEWLRGEHPVPGPGSLAAGSRLLAAAGALGPDDTAVVLLSGGGSALAELPAEGLTLEDLAATTRRLLGEGVPIEGINAVRKRLSALKGGRLAAACGAGRILVLTLSDVAGDDPRVIASGPFAPPDAEDEAWLDRLRPLLPSLPDRPAPAPNPHMAQRILAGPLDLPRRAAELARRKGLHPIALHDFVDGDVEAVASRWGATLAESLPPGTLLAAAAEPTVHLPANPGPGGRSQHLALRLALGLAGTGSAFLAAGSDGRDGDSDHAGAAVDGTTALHDRATIEEALAHASSATACADLGVAIPAWETGTNLADLHLLLIG